MHSAMRPLASGTDKWKGRAMDAERVKLIARLVFASLLIAVLVLLGREKTAQMATPVVATKPLLELDLPEMRITATNDGFTGVPNELAAGRYLVTFVNKSSNLASFEFVEVSARDDPGSDATPGGAISF